MSGHMIFGVECTPLADGRLQVDVDAGDDCQGRFLAADGAIALRLAAAFMYGVVEPESIEAAWQLPTAPDGPEEQG